MTSDLLRFVLVAALCALVPGAQAEGYAPYRPGVAAPPRSVVAAVPYQLPADRGGEGRVLFLNAWAAPDLGAGQPGGFDPPALIGYPLYPWLEAERLKRRVAAGDPLVDGDVQNFLARGRDIAATRELRAMFLERLFGAGRYPDYLAADTLPPVTYTARCRRWTAQIAVGLGDMVLPEIAAGWRAGEDLPPACTAPMAWLRGQPGYQPAWALARLDAALADGRPDTARATLAFLAPEDLPKANARLAFYATPDTALEALVTGGPFLGRPDDAARAMERWARRDADGAGAWLSRNYAHPSLTPALRAALARGVAMGAALARKPEALNWFSQVPAEALDKAGREWRVRAALWNGDWSRAAYWTEEMPAAEANTPRWRYWRGRAEQVLGQPAGTATLEGLASESGWYAMLAAWRLNRPYAPPASSIPSPDSAFYDTPSGRRLVEAWQAGLTDLANAEWKASFNTWNPSERAMALRTAVAWDWHPWALYWGNRSEWVEDPLFYPRPFLDTAHDAARLSGLPTGYLYAIMRQESSFKPDAQSGAKAYGLMQLLLPTAQSTARRWNLSAPTRDSLFTPEGNLPLGAAYLREQIDRNGGRLYMAAAGYNAGPGAVRRWLPPRPMDADVWAENVPYNETRDYIAKVLRNAVMYGWYESGGQPQDLGPIMAPVAPTTGL